MGDPFQRRRRGRSVMGSIWGLPQKTGNNAPLLSDNTTPETAQILNNAAQRRITNAMKHALLPLAAALTLALALPGHAAGCYADYKAKQDNPLRLHYGVAQINGACTPGNAAAQLSPRLAAEGWTLLNVVSVFGEDGLNARKASAGQNYLRF